MLIWDRYYEILFFLTREKSYMNKLIVTADVHGSFGSWLTLKQLMKPGDKLVIAGDLFDTRYGNYSNPDFQPEGQQLAQIILERR